MQYGHLFASYFANVVIGNKPREKKIVFTRSMYLSAVRRATH